MAVGTGMGSKETRQTESELTKEQREKVAKARRPMEIANSFRLFFLFIAVILLLFVYFGGKIWTGAAWYDNAVQSIYGFLLWDVLLMLLSTFIKFFFVARYNRVVKHL
ncbi:MAG: hypothetical protein ACI4ED_06835 [Suilimivivens sp.]